MAAVGVFGVKGGCGASLLATNLGVALAGNDACLLIDLNPMLGSDDLLLDLALEKSWLDLLPVAGELTQHHLDLAAACHASGLRLLGAPPGCGDTVRRADLVKLLKGLKKRFVWILLDIPAMRVDYAQAAFPIADILLLVSTLDHQALRSAKRLVQTLPSELRQKTGLVFNQVMRGHPAEPKATAASLELPLLGVLPFDQHAIGRQVNFGQLCVGDPRSPYGKAVAHLAARLTGGAAQRQMDSTTERPRHTAGGQEMKEKSS
jgi:pilus assembly protein CpaE